MLQYTTLMLIVSMNITNTVLASLSTHPEPEFSTAEPEQPSGMPTGEPVSPEAEVKGIAEGESSGTSPEGESETEWMVTETYVGVIVPPIIFITGTIAGMIFLRFWTQNQLANKLERYRRKKTSKISHQEEKPAILIGNYTGVKTITIKSNSPKFYLEEDHDIKKQFARFQNNIKALLHITAPVVFSLGFCPLTICIYPEMTKFFWPYHTFGSTPKVNDVIACFLMPAGIVYAVAFGFTFQDVLFKRQSIETNFLKQFDAMNKMLAILQYHQGFKIRHQIKILHILKDYTISIMSKLMNIKPHKDTTIMTMINMINAAGDMARKDRIWKLLDVLREAEGGELPEIDKQLSQQMYEHMSLLYAHSVSTEDTRTINIVHWTFLECLGYTSFFGILVLDADSFRLQLTLCILTVLSISAFSFILADVDSPYHGVFRIDLSVFITYLDRLEDVYKNTLSKLSVKEKELLVN